jgi:hypothetical protein
VFFFSKISQELSTQKHLPLLLPIIIAPRCCQWLLPIAVAHRPLSIGHCPSPLPVSPCQLPDAIVHCDCASAVARHRCPSAVAHWLLPVSRCPSAVACRPLTITVDHCH